MNEEISLFKVFMSPEAKSLVAETLESGWIGQGPKVEQFEDALQRLEYLKTRPLATLSGTAALDLAYRLISIDWGDVVISSPMTCNATNTALAAREAKIVWADVDPLTGLVTPESINYAVHWAGDHILFPEAIVAVDYAGRLPKYSEFKKHGVPVVQDGAHSLLAGSPPFCVPEMGDYRMWSFQAIKQLTTGDGGALQVPEDKYERAFLLRWYGLDRRDTRLFRCDQNIPEAGIKAGMNDIAASIGLANIERASWVVDQHRQNAETFHAELKGLRRVELPPYDPQSSYWIFPILVSDPADFRAFMAARGIQASPTHSRNDTKSCYDAVWPDEKPGPGLEEFSRRQCCIPVGWWLTKHAMDRIIDAVRKWGSG